MHTPEVWVPACCSCMASPSAGVPRLMVSSGEEVLTYAQRMQGQRGNF